MVKIVYESRVTRYLGIEGMVLYPFVLISTAKEDTDEIVLKHEFTHVEQIERDGFCTFYFSYLKGLLQWGSVEKAYENNVYEIEAYKKETRRLTAAQRRRIYN
jgi:hypothetical protein